MIYSKPVKCISFSTYTHAYIDTRTYPNTRTQHIQTLTCTDSNIRKIIHVFNRTNIKLVRRNRTRERKRTGEIKLHPIKARKESTMKKRRNTVITQ